MWVQCFVEDKKQERKKSLPPNWLIIEQSSKELNEEKTGDNKNCTIKTLFFIDVYLNEEKTRDNKNCTIKTLFFIDVYVNEEKTRDNKNCTIKTLFYIDI